MACVTLIRRRGLFAGMLALLVGLFMPWRKKAVAVSKTFMPRGLGVEVGPSAELSDDWCLIELLYWWDADNNYCVHRFKYYVLSESDVESVRQIAFRCYCELQLGVLFNGVEPTVETMGPAPAPNTVYHMCHSRFPSQPYSRQRIQWGATGPDSGEAVKS